MKRTILTIVTLLLAACGQPPDTSPPMDEAGVADEH